MNREIKFRAWDIDDRRLKEIVWWDFNNNIITTPKTSGDAHEFIIMQYIGFKDKKGVEVYEGDILFCPFAKDDATHKTGVDVVKWDNGEYVCCGMSLGGQVRYCEVLGNIYLDKKLLND